MKVRNISVVIREDTEAAGYYVVSSYVTGDPGDQPVLGFYRRLSWTEACDVMLAVTDEYRPGMIVEQAGIIQNGLW